jgi:thioredoxin-related protein
MKKIFLLMLCIFLCGCSGYQRDDRPGSIEVISVAEMEEKMAQKETFVILYTQSWCSHCEELKDMLDIYLPAHHVTVYGVIIDKDPVDDKKGNLKKIQTLFPTMDNTPALYYVVDGQIENQLETGDDGITKEKFDAWVQRYRIDEVKKHDS